MSQVRLLHWALRQRGHRAPPRQQGQQRSGAGGCFKLWQCLAPGSAIQLRREQQSCHRGLHVLLRILVSVKGFPQFRGHVLCEGQGGDKDESGPPDTDHLPLKHAIPWPQLRGESGRGWMAHGGVGGLG